MSFHETRRIIVPLSACRRTSDGEIAIDINSVITSIEDSRAKEIGVATSQTVNSGVHVEEPEAKQMLARSRSLWVRGPSSPRNV